MLRKGDSPPKFSAFVVVNLKLRFEVPINTLSERTMGIVGRIKNVTYPPAKTHVLHLLGSKHVGVVSDSAIVRCISSELSPRKIIIHY